MKLSTTFILALCLSALYGQVDAATITVTTNGTVSGAVSVMGPAGTNNNICNPNPGGGAGGGTCVFTFPEGTPLRVTANSPNVPGLLNSGTGNASACATSTCNFTLDSDSSITVTFDEDLGPFPSIQIGLLGDGTGDIGTDNSRCQNYELGYSACTVYYVIGSEAMFQGRSVPGSIWEGFSSGTGDVAACDSAAVCAFTVTGNSSVNASFSKLLSVALTPNPATVGVAQARNFNATGTFSNGATRSVSGINGYWRTKLSLSGPGSEPFGPPMSAPRFALGAGVVNDRLYAIGGVDGFCPESPCEFGPLANVDIYNPAAFDFGTRDSWTPRAPLSIPREGHGVAVVNGRIYAIGGHTSGGGAVATSEVYDPIANAWTSKAPMAAPRAAFATAVIGNVIYAVGGGDSSTPLDTLEAYDATTNTWTTKTPMTIARAFLAAAAVNGKLYAIGGGPGTSAIEEYDPANDIWITKTPMPAARGVVRAGVVDDLIYVVGGQTGPLGGTVDVYNPVTDTWITLSQTPMPTPRSEFALAVLDGRLFAVGGSLAGNVASPVVEAFRPPEATWWSSNTAVATMNQFNGNATGVSAGTSTISARTVGIDSGAQSALLTVTSGGGGGGSQIFLGIPMSAFTQVGNSQWGCGSFFDQNASGGPWSATVNYGDGTGSQALPLTIPPGSGDPCGGSGGGTPPIGVFSFSHSYNSPGMYQVGVTLTNHAGMSKTGGFPIEVTEGGGDEGCALVSTNLAGTVPFNTVHMSLFDRTSGELLFEADVPLGMMELGEAPEGLYRVEFSVPAGYVITPSQIEFDAVCDEPIVLSAQIDVAGADTTPPVVTVPANISKVLTTNAATSAVVTFTASALDAVDGARPVTCAPASGATFSVGTTLVSCTSTDLHGNTSQPATFAVIVVPKNAKAPRVHAPANLKVEATGPSGAIVTYTATATDVVYGTLPVTCAPVSGSLFPLGATTVVCSATNGFGKTDSDQAVITVRDKTAPAIVSVTPSVSLLPDTDETVSVTIAVVATDLVDPAPQCRITRVGSGKDLNDDGVIDWTITGDLSLSIEANARRHRDRTYRIRITCTDASGNKSAERTAIVVSHNP